MKQTLSLLIIFLTLAGCSGPLGKPRDNRVMTSRETCTAACNRDSSLCAEEPSNSRERLQGLGRALNAGRECQLDLGGCLDRCKAL